MRKPKLKTEKQEKPRVETLELNRETLRDLKESKAGKVIGGRARGSARCDGPSLWATCSPG